MLATAQSTAVAGTPAAATSFEISGSLQGNSGHIRHHRQYLRGAWTDGTGCPSIIFDVLLANGVNSLTNDILVEVHSVLNAVNARPPY